MIYLKKHSHYNPWGFWDNIAQRAKWSEPGLFAIYMHDGWRDSADSRSGSNQLDPWFQMYKYNFETDSWEPYETELPKIPLTKWVDWRMVYGIGAFPDIYWYKSEGEYPDWRLNYGLRI